MTWPPPCGIWMSISATSGCSAATTRTEAFVANHEKDGGNFVPIALDYLGRLYADQAMLDNLHFTKELGYHSLAALEGGNLDEFARLMDVHWQRKKARSSLPKRARNCLTTSRQRQRCSARS